MVEVAKRFVAGEVHFSYMVEATEQCLWWAKVHGAHPAIVTLAAEWQLLADRVWNEWGQHGPDVHLPVGEFRLRIAADLGEFFFGGRPVSAVVMCHGDSRQMRIVIQDSNRFGHLAPERLAAFEKSLGTMLPEPYRVNLQAHNGGYVDGAREIYELHHVHGIHDGPNWARFPVSQAIYGGVVPQHLLPIADDPGGNLICLVLNGSNRGAVCFWDHERARSPDESITELAPDFDAFLRGLAVKVAIARGDVDLVREAIEEVGLDAPVYAGKTMLDLAFDQGSEPIIGLLMNKGAKVRDDALLEAVRNASIETVQVLLARGIDVNFAIPDTGFTALMLAASRDTTEIAELLLHHAADPSKRNRWGKTAAELAHSSKMKKLLGAK